MGRQSTARRFIPPCLCAALLLLCSGTGCVTSTVRYTRPSRSDTPGTQRASGEISLSKLQKIVNSYRGTPYRHGGMSRKGMDCSGFVSVVFRELNGAKLPRSTKRQRYIGRAVPLKLARAGDLVFFRGGRWNTINHVGIMLGKKRFAHASTKRGVTISSLDSDYHRRHFAGLRRILK